MKNRCITRLPKRVLLPPGQPAPIPCYPPYSSKSSSNSPIATWRVAETSITEVEQPATPDAEKELIDQWVEQLIRAELGSALPDVAPLKVNLGMDVVLVIQKALRRRGGAKPSRHAGRRRRRPAAGA